MSTIVGYLPAITTAFFVLGCVVHALPDIENAGLQTLAKGFAASTIPTALALVACSFDQTLLTKLSDIHLYVAAAGVALLLLSIQELRGGKR